MGFFDRLRSTLGSDQNGDDEDSADVEDDIDVDFSGSFDPDFPEPNNKSTLGDDEWRWDRVGEQPFDHYTDATDRIAELKREQRYDEAEELLLWCIDYVEAEAAFHQRREYGYETIAPAYYRDLAIVYQENDRHQDAVEVLERYVDACRDLENEPQDDMITRLERARESVDAES